MHLIENWIDLPPLSPKLTIDETFNTMESVLASGDHPKVVALVNSSVKVITGACNGV